jgi:hypothetical protein
VVGSNAVEAVKMMGLVHEVDDGAAVAREHGAALKSAPGP